MKKRFCGLLILIMLITQGFVFTSCGDKEEQADFYVYYLDADVTKVVSVPYQPKASSGEELIPELLDVMTKETPNGELHNALPSGVSILGWEHKSFFLTIDFSEEYLNLQPAEEILCRAAIVRTMTQADDVLYVSFTIHSESFLDSAGNSVGPMSADSFVENPGQQINSSISTTLTLYFSNEKGDALVPEKRVVHHSSNVSVEKLVMEQLIGGPRTAGLRATIPSGTKVITVSVVDRVCYVNMNETFMNQNNEITEAVVLFSIVNSLTNLPEVDKVQLSVNGDSSGKCRYIYDLAVMYEADPLRLEGAETETTETETEEE